MAARKLSVRPPAFNYHASLLGSRKASLYCEEISVVQLAKKHGTPLYVYSASTIRDRFRAFDSAFSKYAHTVCYAVKANGNISILKMLAALGCGFDVVSGGEIERVLHADKRAAGRIVFSGVGKTIEEMDLALRAGILLFNVESESELFTLAQRAARSKKTARVALRVNPDVQAGTHPYISTGLSQHKFGISVEEARKLYKRATKLKGLDVAGVSCHIGSQITDIAPFAEAVARLADLVRGLRADGVNLRYLDAGGGLGIAYTSLDELPDFDEHVSEYARAIMKQLSGLDVHLLLEPGRFLVGTAGALITRVAYEKTNGPKRFLIVDAAMNDLIRPSLYGAHHEIIPVLRKPDAKKQAYDVVGPICETGDFFARDRQLPKIGEGELVAILDSGAYGMAISSNYNARPRAAEVLVDRRSSRLIRRRETFKDMVRNEL
jgi:diaminopimelate decarboxylase